MTTPTSKLKDVTFKELELEKERLINENLDLKLHIQYLEELVADQASLKESSFLEYLNPRNDRALSKQNLLEQKLEDAYIQIEEAKKEAEYHRSVLEATKRELEKVRLESSSSLVSNRENRPKEQHLGGKIDVAVNTDPTQRIQLENLKGDSVSNVHEFEEERQLQTELEISREFVKAESSSLNGFQLALEAERRIAELEKSLEETRASSLHHKKR